MNRDKQTVAQVNAGLLPCMPHVLLYLLASDETEPDHQWLQAIHEDPVLTARVVSAWTSKAGGSNNVPADVAHAITALGSDNVRAIVRNAAIQQVFSAFNSRPTAELKKHWWRAIIGANLAEMLSQQIGYPHPEEARLAGMLGALDSLAAWAVSFKKNGAHETTDLKDKQHQSIIPLPIASGLAEEWRLHPFLIDALRYQREPIAMLVDAHPLVRIVHLANSLADYLTGVGSMPVDAGKLFFGLDAPELDRMGVDALHSGAETAQKFGIKFTEKSDTAALDSTVGERRRHRHALADFTVPAGESPLDAEIKRELTRVVRDLALMDSLRSLLSKAQDPRETLTYCSQTAQILFGLTAPIYFVMDKAQKWRAYPLPGQDPRLEELLLPTQDERSLAAMSIHKNSPVNSFSGYAETVFDQQLTQLLSSSGVLYLPCMTRGILSALAVFGIEPHQRRRLEKQQGLLSRFGVACAQALQPRAEDSAAHTDRLQAQLTALQSQTLRVAHEVNNPLSILKNYIKLISMKLDDGIDVKNDLRIFNEEIDRVSRIIRGLKSPAIPVPSVASSIDINDTIRDLIEILVDTLFAPAKVTVKLELAENLPPITTQRDKLKQILLNLLKNATEAMPVGGHITVTTLDNVNHDGRPYVEIRVADAGPGLSAAVMAHLFEPVTSTKGGDHAGLGLAIVQQLVEEMHASITCISARSGLTFHLLIPKTVADG